MTNQSGTTVAELFYDPFGRRTDTNYDPLAGMVPARPGYTGHTHDDELGLIDMKGRVYDIDARRFLTPDPFIPAPLFSQSHNRYSYVWNNPATLIDPTGFDPDDFETETSCFLIFCWTNSSAGDGSVGGGTTGDGGGLPNGTSTPELAPGSGPVTPGATPSSSDASGTSPFEHQGSGGGDYVGSFADPTWGFTGRGAYVGSYGDPEWGMHGPVELDPHSEEARELDYQRRLANGEIPPGAQLIHDRFTRMAGQTPEQQLLRALVMRVLAGSEGGPLPVAARGGLKAGDAGRHGDLVRAGAKGDGITPHHMPQAAQGFTSAADGGALALPHPEHALTRTYGSAGRATLRAEKGMSFRTVLARDMRDIRRLFGSVYDGGLRQLLDYYRTHFPDLMRR